ncbi:hypothetical protein [Lactiplantibacillus paraxiangfangensis]|uniref:hypothetical protein n=1 Tax=Lactiplantibacillus paraxiangfangensis TaxID=3076224 RepID=UPI0030C6B0E7
MTESTLEFQKIMVDRFDSLTKQEAHAMLEPIVQRVSKEYLLVDRKTAFKILCMSRAYFDENFKNKPQVKVIERHLSGSRKVFYDPNELKKAILSIME